jgi:hypothetical protein
MTVPEVLSAISQIDGSVASIFSATKTLTEELRRDDHSTGTKLDLVVRFLDKTKSVSLPESGVGEVIAAVCRDVGLFPYINPQDASFRDLVSYAYHVPAGLNGIVFHRVQTEVYQALLNGENVVLSAPTSFGKSLIVDALIASERYRTIVLVVPTIALIDETRRRLWTRFKHQFQIITHRSQTVRESEPVVYVLTQERLQERENIKSVDLFMIDEVYKIDPRRNDDRMISLNIVAYRFMKSAKQFYFLGPNFQDIDFGEIARRPRLFVTQYKTVAVDLEDRFGLEDPTSDLLALLSTLRGEQTLLFVKSPQSALDIARKIIERDELDFETSSSVAMADWLGREFDESWTVAEAARRGVGIHHGRIPRAVAQKFVREFNAHKLTLLICTSTLIEGVNSAAKNVIIFDKQINRKNYDFFTYANIQGRAGRMFHHFIGKVYRYHEPPDEEEVAIESPLKDVDRAPDSLLMIVDDEDLTERSRQRISDIAAVSIVSVDLLKRYATLGPEFVNNAATILREVIGSEEGRKFLWRGNPDYEELEAVCRFIWEFLKQRNNFGAPTARSLTYWINDLKRTRNAANFLKARLAGRREHTVDEVIDDVFRFFRSCEYTLPTLFGLIQDVINEFAEQLEVNSVDYSYMIRGVENWFMSDGVKILEEYGIPLQISQKVGVDRAEGYEIDQTLATLRASVEDGNIASSLSQFEVDWLRDAIGA